MTRPGPPGAPGRGHRWVPVVVDDVRLLVDHVDGRDWKCDRGASPMRKLAPCNAIALVEIRPEDGGYHWHYRCPNHLPEGVWIEYGVAWQWAQEPTGDEEEE